MNKTENEISIFTENLKNLWLKYPMLRFSQVVNLIETENFFYTEDNVILNNIENILNKKDSHLEFNSYFDRIEKLFDYIGYKIENYIQFYKNGGRFIAIPHSKEIEIKINEFQKKIEEEMVKNAKMYLILKSLEYNISNGVIWFPKFEISLCNPDIINNLTKIKI